MIDIQERTQKKPLPVPFYAVIFANGEDCDAFGLEAASANDFVMFDERLFMPGEDITIEGRDLYFSRRAVLTGSGGRHITITRCNLLCGF